jgi:hypothetical protein
MYSYLLTLQIIKKGRRPLGYTFLYTPYKYLKGLFHTDGKGIKHLFYLCMFHGSDLIQILHLRTVKLDPLKSFISQPPGPRKLVSSIGCEMKDFNGPN